jgi:hypothetical protein
MDLQRIHIKILSDAPQELKLEPFITIFSRWRADKSHPAGWVDLADYAHVPRGAGVVLAGYHANIAFDMAGPAPGVLYVSRNGLTGDLAARIRSAFASCCELSQKLIAEKEFPRDVKLRTDSIELRFPDRLITPDTPATDAALRPAVEAVVSELFGAHSAKLARDAAGDSAYGFSIRAASAEPLDVLLRRSR